MHERYQQQLCVNPMTEKLITTPAPTRIHYTTGAVAAGTSRAVLKAPQHQPVKTERLATVPCIKSESGLQSEPQQQQQQSKLTFGDLARGQVGTKIKRKQNTDTAYRLGWFVLKEWRNVFLLHKMMKVLSVFFLSFQSINDCQTVLRSFDRHFNST